GMSSALPIALRDLEFEGKLERTLEGGRLDTERYAWRVPKKNPFDGAKLPGDAADRNARVAKLFFRWTGPATADDFRAWTCLGAKETKAALEKLPLAPIGVDGYSDKALVLEEDLAILKQAAEASSTIAFLSFEDYYSTSHGGPAVLADPKHHAR